MAVSVWGVVALWIAGSDGFSPTTVPVGISVAWEEANKAYDQGDFDAAARRYRQILEVRESHETWFNLGNAYYLDGHIGASIAAFRNAKRLAPNDAHIDHNLDLARRAAPERTITTDQSYWWRGMTWLRVKLSALARFALFAASYLTVIVLIALRRSLRSVSAWWFVVPAALAGALLTHTVVLEWCAPRAVVVVAERVVAYSAADSESIERLTLFEGSELALLARQHDWLRVRLPDGTQGWIQRSATELPPIISDSKAP